MKKTYIYMYLAAVAIAVAALTVSCVRELDFQRSQTADCASIRITPICDGPMTKADDPTTIDGDDNYNENIIDNYYWFIYSDETGSTMKLSGHVDSNEPQEILLDEAFPTGGTGYVYVVANLPADEFTFANGGIKTIATGAVAKTVNELKAITFGKPTPLDNTGSITAGRSEFYNYTSATTGVPAPERFVMRTPNPISFTLVEKQVVPVTAELKRVAAKIIVNLKIAKSIRQTRTEATGHETYVKTWAPDKEHLQVYMLWGSTNANLAADKTEYSSTNATGFYSASPRYAMYSNNGGVYNPTSREVDGSVPSSSFGETSSTVRTSVWEIVYKVREQNGEPIWNWYDSTPTADRISNNIGDKYYGDWEYELNANNQKIPVLLPDGTVQRRLATETVIRYYWTISSKPFYSMPISWDVNDPNAPFIKVVLPWLGRKISDEGYGSVIEETDGAPTQYYYKILLPQMTALDDNRCYQIDLDLAVLGSELDDVPVEITGNYHVIGWNEAVDMGGDQIAGRYLDCATSFEFYSQNVMTIPVRSSHDIEIVGTPTAQYQNYSDATITTDNLVYSTESATDDNFMVTATANNKVTVSHAFNMNLVTIAPKDVSPITYTFTIQHKGEGGAAYQKTITVIQYPALYVKQDPSNHYVFVNGYGGASSTVSALDNSGTTFTYNNVVNSSNPGNYLNATRLAAFLGNVVSPNANLGEGNANTNNYNIYVSALKQVPESLAGAYISDPREDVGTTLPNINNLSNYRKTRQDATMAIAPAFKIASSYGMCANFSLGGNNSLYGGISYDNAVKRCATYQENGYPAGRWRVPTKAEILFAVSLSKAGCVPPLFNGAYRANDGQYYDSTTGTFTGSATDRSTVRCVYDIWYWGEEKYDNNGNKIVGSGTPATQWIGFKNN